jgi:hypothetical protein
MGFTSRIRQASKLRAGRYIVESLPDKLIVDAEGEFRPGCTAALTHVSVWYLCSMAPRKAVLVLRSIGMRVHLVAYMSLVFFFHKSLIQDIMPRFG